MEDCIFCNLENSRIENKSEFFISIKDLYPVTKEHTLIISKRHVASYFDLSTDEKSDLISFLDFNAAWKYGFDKDTILIKFVLVLDSPYILGLQK
mgnify:CR=1 FL=1